MATWIRSASASPSVTDSCLWSRTSRRSNRGGMRVRKAGKMPGLHRRAALDPRFHHPPILAVPNHRSRASPGPLPQSADHELGPKLLQRRCARHVLAHGPKPTNCVNIFQGCQLVLDNLVLDAMAFFQVPQAEGVGMRAETANECVDWIQLRVTEEPNPEFEVAGAASGVVDFSAGPVPQASPPERRFLLDVTIGSRQKRPAR